MSIVFLRTEPNSNRLLRFHAMQSLMLFGAWVACLIAFNISATIFSFIPVINVLVGTLAGVGIGLSAAAYFLISIFLMIKGLNGEDYKLPLLGAYAEKYVPEQTDDG